MSKRRYETLLWIPLLVSLAQMAAADEAKEPNGQDIVFDNRKGNCLACHAIPGDPKAVTNANIAPPLIGMKARFPDREKLRAQIWNAMEANQNTVMPPFGKHRILTGKEIDKAVDYLYTL